jgi:3-oxoacyl-[acyl-carrier protein] reductase
MNPLRLEGRIALVTGASRGIGRAIALRLAAEGADLAIHFKTDQHRAEAVAQEVRALGRRAVAFPADVRDERAVGWMVQRVEQFFGRIDVLVNNAGVEFEEPIEATTEEHWDDTFAVNVKGLFFCSRAVAGVMEAAAQPGGRSGAIVNIASRFAFLGDPGSLAYSSSKAAVINITKGMAKRYAPAIRVNCVAPAYTPTDMMAHVTPEYLARTQENTPLRRFTRPEDTAAAVAFLASDDASFTTGQTILVDGGYTLK